MLAFFMSTCPENSKQTSELIGISLALGNL